MNAMQAVLLPISEFGPSVSASVYKLPASVEGERLAELVAQEPQLASLVASGRAKVNGIRFAEGGGLLAIGGIMDAAVFEKAHGVLTAIGGVEFVVGAGPGCSTLPRTAIGNASVGASDRSKTAKPWWRLW
jgi:hypothetical protein